MQRLDCIRGVGATALWTTPVSLSLPLTPLLSCGYDLSETPGSPPQDAQAQSLGTRAGIAWGDSLGSKQPGVR
jgi:hypothetical protein